MTPEFSRPVDADTISETPRRVEIAADETERRKLGGRFSLQAIDHLTAALTLVRRASILHIDGMIDAAVVQSCVVTGEPLPALVKTPVSVRFVSDDFGKSDEEEIELSADDLDTLLITDGCIDLGELAAETLALALDPYPRSIDAETVLRDRGLAGEDEAGPFAALQALKDRMSKPD